MVSKSPLTWHRVKVDAALLLLGGSKSPGFPLRLLRRARGASYVCSLCGLHKGRACIRRPWSLLTLDARESSSFSLGLLWHHPKERKYMGKERGTLLLLVGKKRKSYSPTWSSLIPPEQRLGQGLLGFCFCF